MENTQSFVSNFDDTRKGQVIEPEPWTTLQFWGPPPQAITPEPSPEPSKPVNEHINPDE